MATTVASRARSGLASKQESLLMLIRPYSLPALIDDTRTYPAVLCERKAGTVSLAPAELPVILGHEMSGIYHFCYRRSCSPCRSHSRWRFKGCQGSRAHPACYACSSCSWSSPVRRVGQAGSGVGRFPRVKAGGADGKMQITGALGCFLAYWRKGGWRWTVGKR